MKIKFSKRKNSGEINAEEVQVRQAGPSRKTSSNIYSHLIVSSLLRLFSHLSPRRRWQLAGLSVFMSVGAGAEMATLGAVVPFFALLADPSLADKYQFLKCFFGLFGWTSRESLIPYMSILFGVIAVLSALIRVGLSWASNKYTESLGGDLSCEVYRRTLYQPYSFHVLRNTSEIIAGINKVNNVISGIITPLIQSMVALLTSFGILVVLLQIDFLAAIFAIVSFSILYFMASIFTRRKLHGNGRLIAENHTRRIQAIQEGLGGIRDVLIDSTQTVYLARYREFDHATRRAQAVNCFISASPRYVIEAFGMILILGLALWLSQKSGGLMSAIPVLGGLALGAQKLLPQMQSLYNCWAQVSGNHAMLSDVLNLLNLPVSEEYLKKTQQGTVQLARHIALRDVSFRYNMNAPIVIRKLSLEIPHGTRIGFIGKTGSGKSTLIDLIMGLLEPSDGAIEIDGRPLTREIRRSWQALIAHVPQTVFLSDSTIAANIAFGSHADEIDLDRVRVAASKAQLADFIETLPDGYQTFVGERGVRLSGGQRQRLGLARALYKKADVLILDEATSALDDDTERSVMEVIDGLGRDVTILIIAHRLTTLRNCDLVGELYGNGNLRLRSYTDLITEKSESGKGMHRKLLSYKLS
ncbi:ABC transporter ATP-binding protein [Desulfuromonas sp. TF]|uniref:ABC transporter ATP-binding protein n=1 Tax=Desulfuromonas sp. TF TaxID=1232410 RepID=UPI00042975E0|nr:ABC transporter ATP-binding protein [Desulfuromonas sp. TF]